MASGNQVISPTSGYTMSQVTVNKPSTLIAGNIKKDVNIGGVTGTYEGSSGGLTNYSGTLSLSGLSGYTWYCNFFGYSNGTLVAHNSVKIEQSSTTISFYDSCIIVLNPSSGAWYEPSCSGVTLLGGYSPSYGWLERNQVFQITSTNPSIEEDED